MELCAGWCVLPATQQFTSKRHSFVEDIMGFGRGLLLWLIGIPLPIIILLALFWHN